MQQMVGFTEMDEHAAGRSAFMLPQDDLPAAEARALLGPRRILGVSVKTPEQAVAAAAAGADYLGAGAGGGGCVAGFCWRDGQITSACR
jgi:Thiamine monophosphate synthase